jgi:hypothetical protein
MNDKNLVRQIDLVTSEVNDIFGILVNKIDELEQDLIELEKQHEESLKVAFNEGYAKGYTNHANLINMLNK